jgi:signal transduction histidine kinase
MRWDFRPLRDLMSPVSLRGGLIVFVLATLMPLIIFAVAMIVRLGNEERRTFQRGATERTRALVTAIDSRLESSIAQLSALATSPSLTEGNLEVFQERCRRILKTQPDWSTINVARPSGEQVMSALLPLDALLRAKPRDPRSFEIVVRTGRPAVGDLVEDPVAKRVEYSVRVPVVREGVIKYVLSAVLRPQSMSDLLKQQKLPPNWVGVVLDDNRRFVARTIELERSVGRLASESLRSALDRSSEGWFRGSTVEGWDVYTPYSRSSFSGWTVALGIPADAVDATFRRSLTQLVLFGSGLFGLALVIAWALGTRAVASVKSLAAMAEKVGSSTIIPGVNDTPDPIVEIEAVRQAFIEANRLLREQSEEKQRIALRLQLALASGNIGVYEWSPQTGELVWDDRVRAHWGLSPGAQVTYEMVLRGLHSKDRVRVKKSIQRALESASDSQYSAEFRVTGLEDGVERWIDARGQVIADDGKPIRLTGTTLDITERKAFQAELERQVAERTARLKESIGELEAFSYSISHDMRAPLRAMEGYAEALMSDYADRLDAEGRHWLDRISRSARRLDSLIKDVLAYSRMAKGEVDLAPVDLERLVDDILAANPEFQPPRARIIVEKPLHQVIGHEASLTQCVTNLLGNAVKFVAGGIVPEIHIRTERLDGKVRIWFEDNGIGIDAAHHRRIFEIFGQVHPEEKFQGTGIGLAIVRKAAQRMSGDVGVESQLGQGSRFWLILNEDRRDA